MGHERLGVIAHEIIHVLGRNHVDAGQFPKTLMVAGGSEEVPADILHPLDREALLAVYTPTWSRGSHRPNSLKRWGRGPTPRCTCAANWTSGAETSRSVPR